MDPLLQDLKFSWRFQTLSASAKLFTETITVKYLSTLQLELGQNYKNMKNYKINSFSPLDFTFPPEQPGPHCAR